MKKYILGIISAILICGYICYVCFHNNSQATLENKSQNITQTGINSSKMDNLQVNKPSNEYSKEEEKPSNEIKKIVLTEGQKFSDILKQFGMTDEKEIKRMLTSYQTYAYAASTPDGKEFLMMKGDPNNQIDIDKEAKSGDIIRISISNGKIRKIIIKLGNGKKYVIDGGFSYTGRWRIDSSSKKDILLAAVSHNLKENLQYFFVYTGTDKSKKNLDIIVSKILKSIKSGDSFDLYDDYNAAIIAYIDWSSVLFSNQIGKRKDLYDEVKQCYNYQLEHSLVGSDNFKNIIFSNYELNKEYQANLRSGIYKKCDPEEFIDSYHSIIELLHFSEGLENHREQHIREQAGKPCQELIRKKFRYVNSIVFEKNMVIDIKDDKNIANISGTLRVEATNGVKAKQTYTCTYDVIKKEFTDWSVDSQL